MAVGNHLRRVAGSRIKPRRNSLQRGCRRGRAPGGCPRKVEEGDEASERIVVRRTPADIECQPSPSSLEKLHHGELRDALAVLPRASRRPPSHLLTFQDHRASPCSRRDSVPSTSSRSAGLRVLRARRSIPMSAGIWVFWMSCTIRENIVIERRVVVEERCGREFYRKG